MQIEETSGGIEGSQRDHNEISPMHAAAVNGDRSSLAKLVAGMKPTKTCHGSGGS